MNDLHLSYYPGCTLDSTAREIDDALHQVCRRLDIHLEKLPDWNCCGSSSVHAVRPQEAVSLAARNLFQAQATGKDLLVVCAGCSNRLRGAAHHLRNDPVTRRVNANLLGDRLGDELRIHHLLDVLPDRLRRRPWSRLRQRALNGLRFVPYYGCLLSSPPDIRPPASLGGSMEALMEWLGAENRNWAYHGKCCGSFLSVARPDIVAPMVEDIMEKARHAGADCVVTACAMCQLNLELRAPARLRLPVFSILELLGYGLGSESWPSWFRRHLVDPMPLFRKNGLDAS